MNRQQYTWTGLYSELADKLLPFKDNRHKLIEKLQMVYVGLGMKLPRLDSSSTPADIDPYTVYEVSQGRLALPAPPDRPGPRVRRGRTVQPGRRGRRGSPGRMVWL